MHFRSIQGNDRRHLHQHPRDKQKSTWNKSSLKAHINRLQIQILPKNYRPSKGRPSRANQGQQRNTRHLKVHNNLLSGEKSVHL